MCIRNFFEGKKSGTLALYCSKMDMSAYVIGEVDNSLKSIQILPAVWVAKLVVLNKALVRNTSFERIHKWALEDKSI